jgi:hypothetical protein
VKKNDIAIRTTNTTAPTYKFCDLKEKDNIIKILQPYIKEKGKEKVNKSNNAKEHVCWFNSCNKSN